MTTYGPGTPLTVTQQSVFKGLDRTNGWVMRNSDGRVQAIKEGFAKIVISGGSVLAAAAAIPYGNGLWKNRATIDTNPGTIQADKPAVAEFVGIMEFQQGMQTGHPVQGWGVLQYGKGILVRQGLVGYKQAMTAVGQEANYLALLQGDKTKDTGTVRKVYADWMATEKAAADGDRLAVFFGNASGFPIVSLVLAANIAAPTLANATFGGWVEIREKENEAIYLNVAGFKGRP